MRNRLRFVFSAMLASWMVCGCDTETATDAGLDSGPLDTGVDLPDAGCEGPPGLYVEGSCSVLAEDVRAYHPRFALWSDAAEKERFVYLPPGTRIDATLPDDWSYPVGTRIYKTFLHDGVRLETRLLEKTGGGTGRNSWSMRVFTWNAEQNAVNEVMDGAQNVLGTQHDVPATADCGQCHWAVGDVVNSFTAIQLNHNEGGVTLQTLIDEGWITPTVDTNDATVPGDATAVAALGYLHANCGNCHRPTPNGPLGGCVTPACTSRLHLWVNVGLSSVETTSAYTTAVGVRSTFGWPDNPTAYCRIHPTQPNTSMLVVRMENRGNGAQMPPLATEIVHPEGNAAVRAWISLVNGDSSECTSPP